MAKKSYSGGPGTQVSGGVCRTIDPPFSKGMGKGSQKDLSGTFDKPRSGGDNGLPTRVGDTIGGKAKSAAPDASQRDGLGTVLADPHSDRGSYR